MSKRPTHRQALRQLLDESLGASYSDAVKDKLVGEILRLNARFNCNPSLDEALNSGNGSYKP